MELQAARRCPRPAVVTPGPQCGAPAGRHYGSCPACTDVVERIWQADWDALLTAESIARGSDAEQLLAQVVVAEFEQHPWTVVDTALTLLRCSECGCELGGGPKGCTSCEMAFGYAMAAEWKAGQLGLVSRNEHALHVGRWVLRHPHRQSEKTLTGWRFSLPVLLTGVEPPSAKLVQATQALILAGREDEVARLWAEERQGKREFPWFKS